MKLSLTLVMDKIQLKQANYIGKKWILLILEKETGDKKSDGEKIYISPYYEERYVMREK